MNKIMKYYDELLLIVNMTLLF